MLFFVSLARLSFTDSPFQRQGIATHDSRVLTLLDLPLFVRENQVVSTETQHQPRSSFLPT